MTDPITEARADGLTTVDPLRDHLRLIDRIAIAIDSLADRSDRSIARGAEPGDCLSTGYRHARVASCRTGVDRRLRGDDEEGA